MTILALVLLFVALGIRALPLVWHNGHSGVDHWYWLSYHREARRTWRLPRLPLYLLEEAQWYPPLFPLLLMPFSEKWLMRAGTWLSIGCDLARLALLLHVVERLTGGAPAAVLAAGAVYMTTPLLVTYNYQLNPRALAALLLDILMIACLWAAPVMTRPFTWLVIAVTAPLILLCHKMTTQLLFFLALFLSMVGGGPVLCLIIPLAVILATLISGGFYIKVWRAHLDIVRFWTREWPWLGADSLRDSPLYGRPGVCAPGRQFTPGIKGMARRGLSLVLGNYAPAVTIALLVVLTGASNVALPGFGRLWLVGIMLFVILTVFVPFCRGLGFGNLYLYNAAFPAALVLGLTAVSGGWWVASVAVVINILVLVRSLRYHRRSSSPRLPDSIVTRIRECGDEAWLCFPLTYSEHVVFLAEKPVLWGGHGYGFDRLRSVYPILREDFATLRKRHGLRYVLLDDDHRPDFEGTGADFYCIHSGEGFHLMDLGALG